MAAQNDSYQITFERNGNVSVFAFIGNSHVSVQAPINQLQALLPSAVFDAVRDRMAAFLDMTGQASRLQAVR